MQVKKFEAKNMQEALQKIKTELGPEAVILQAKEKKGLLGTSKVVTGVEVTVAIAKGSLIKKQLAESKMLPQTAERLKNSSATIQKEVYNRYAERMEAVFNSSRGLSDTSGKIVSEKSSSNSAERRKPINNVRYVDIQEEDSISADGTVQVKNPTIARKSIVNNYLTNATAKVARQEDSSLAEAVVNSKVSNDEQKLNEQGFSKKQYIREKLLFEGVDEYYIDQIIKVIQHVCKGDLNEIDDTVLEKILLKVLESQVKAVEENFVNLSASGIYAFVGPSQSGRTTTIAKIASRLKSNNNKKVALVYCDTNNSKGLEQISIYAKIINAPLKIASNKSELISSLRDLSENDIILIDAPSASNTEELVNLTSVLPSEYGIVSNLVLSSVEKDSTIRQVVESYDRIDYSTLVFTKLDEAVSYGSVFNACVAAKKPISFVTVGKKVPEDIDVPSAQDIAEMVLIRTGA